MKKDYKYIALLAVLILTLGVLEYNRPKKVDWRITLSNKDKIPFGTYATFDLLKDIFPKQKITSSRLPVFNELSDTKIKGNYIFITPSFDVNDTDVEDLLKFVKEGNNLFVASADFNQKFADTLGFKINSSFTKLSYKTNLTGFDNTWPYNFDDAGENNYFDSLNHKTTVVLGKKISGQPDFIRIKHGKGNIYLNVNSTAFSNYFVLNKTTEKYAFQCLSYLPVAPVTWDEYTKQGRLGEQGVFRVLMEHSALKYAYYIMILGTLLFIIFESKRRQRIIPIIKPLPNNTLEFTKVVGTLYYNKGDHYDVAIKKINHLLEFIRGKFYERTNVIDDEFIERITEKTGFDQLKSRQLFEMIRWIKSRPLNSTLSETDLLLLNDLIEEFYEFVKH